MKICVTLLSELRTLIIEIGEDEPIDSLSSILNTELKTNVDFNFIFNNNICENGKTAGELNFVDDCKVYAVKKHERPLKRELDSDSLNEILNHGSSVKKLCTDSNSNYCEYLSWQNKSMDKIQLEMSEIVSGNPEVLEPLILQPQVEKLIHNPSIISSMFSANPIINDSINNSPNKVKFFNDTSQYSWIKDIMGNSKELESIMTNCPDHLKHVVDSKRYRRMMELFEKTAEKTDESEAQIDLKLLEPFTKSLHASKIVDLMVENKHLSELVVKNCPYGSLLSPEALNSLQQVIPDAFNQLKKAMDQSKEPEDVLNYLRSNPIEIDEDVAKNIEEMTSKFNESQDPVCPASRGSVEELMFAISDRIKGESAEDRNDELCDQFENKKELLNEMGFIDNDFNVEVLVGEYGNLDRSVNKLLSTS